MKKLYKNTKSRLLIVVCFLFAAGAFASPIAVVKSVQGDVFVVTDGKTRPVDPGDHIKDFSEIITGEGAQITFSDYYDHKYNMAGSGHIKLLNKMLEIKRGYVWLQSFNKDAGFSIQTANAKVSYAGGEAIVSFNSYSGKSQILVVKGNFEFGNLLEDYMKLEVTDGQFSFIHNDHERGAPRSPTPVGYASFKKIMALFHGVEPVKKKDHTPTNIAKVKSDSEDDEKMVSGAGRVIASVADEKGSKIYIKKQKKFATKHGYSLIEQYTKQLLDDTQTKKKKRKVFKRSYVKKSGVKINIFGAHPAHKARVPAAVKKKNAKRPNSRAPASMLDPIAPKVRIYKTDEGNFENYLTNEYKAQMRHDNEVNSLIDDLKNYDQDYKKSH